MMHFSIVRVSTFQMLILLTSFIGLSPGSGFAQDAKKKYPVPKADAQAKVEKLIKELFKAEYAKKNPDEIRALAAKLQKQATETNDDPVARFVLFREARNLFAKAGDIKGSLSVIDIIAKEYEVKAIALKAETLGIAIKQTTTPEANKTLAEISLEVIEQALKDDDFDVAGLLLLVAEAASKKAKSVSLLGKITTRRGEIQKLHKEYQQIQAAIKVLKDKPDDAKANSVVGQYHCFRKGNWDKGLPFLAKGDNPNLKELAKLELSKPSTNTAKVRLADSWWQLAAKQTGKAKSQIQLRSLHWYEEAIPKLTGFTKARVQRRIDSIYKENPSLRPANPQLAKVYLSDLKELDAKVGFGRFGKKGHLGYLQDPRIMVRDKLVPNGLSMHPPSKGYSTVKYRLNKKARLFKAGAALNDKARKSESPLTFQVLGDNDVLWTSKEIQRPGQIQDCEVKVEGIEILELRVRCPGSFNQAQAVWVDPYVIQVSNGDSAQLPGIIRRFVGHTAPVLQAVFSPDGRQILSCGWDKTIRLWDVESGKELRQFTSHADNVNAAAFSPDGTRAVSCGNDATVRLWEVSSGKQLHLLRGHKQRVNDIAFSPDGKRILSAGFDKTVRLWDVDSGKLLHTFIGHTESVTRVTFISKGQLAVTSSGGRETAIRVWDLKNKKEFRRLSGGAISLALPDGRTVAYSITNGLSLVDVTTGKNLGKLIGHRVQCMDYSPRTGRLITGSRDKTVKLWDFTARKEVHCFRDLPTLIWSVAFSPDGRYAVTAGGGQIVNRGLQPGQPEHNIVALWRLPE